MIYLLALVDKRYMSEAAGAQRKHYYANFCNYSELLVACGDSLNLVVRAGIAARGNARTHHQTPANCCRVPIHRARAARSLGEKRPE